MSDRQRRSIEQLLFFLEIITSQNRWTVDTNCLWLRKTIECVLLVITTFPWNSNSALLSLQLNPRKLPFLFLSHNWRCVRCDIDLSHAANRFNIITTMVAATSLEDASWCELTNQRHDRWSNLNWFRLPLNVNGRCHLKHQNSTHIVTATKSVEPTS